MQQILVFLQQHPEAQAALAGMLVSLAMALYKRLSPKTSSDTCDKLKQTWSAVAMSLVAAAITTGLSGEGWWPALLLNAAAAYLSSQAAYGVGKSAQKIGNGVLTSVCSLVDFDYAD